MKNSLSLLFLALAMGHPLRANTFVVTTTEDEPNTASTGALSLREAVTSLGTGTGTICFSPSLVGQTFRLESTLFLGASGGRITIDGSTTNGSRPVIEAGEGVGGSFLISAQNRDVRLENIVIDGKQNIGTGVSVNGAELQMFSVEITGFDNIGASVTGGEANFGDSYFHRNEEAIRLNQSEAEINRCLIAFHRRTGVFATGLGPELVVRFRNCTFAENQGFGTSRGVLGLAGTDVLAAVVHCSFVDNAGYAFSGPKEVQLLGNLFARNTLDATGGETVSVVETLNLGMTSFGYNLTDAGTSEFDDPTDIVTTNANVSRLGDYGGALMCCFPYARSAAIDGGIPDRNFPLLFDDIRGFQRLAQTTSNDSTNVMDIGAVETNPNGTIEITDTFGSNSGSLAQALAAATNETNHLVIRTPITQQVFKFLTKRVFGGDRNYNLDATRATYQFTSDDADEELFEIGDGVTTGTSASFDGFNFVGFEADASAPGTGVVSIRSGCRASFHRCSFDGNTTGVKGVIDSAGHVFLNETEILNSNQIGVVGENGTGGAGIRSTGGTVTAWNSTFARNRAKRSGMKGGAIQLSQGSRGSFRFCSFIGNEATTEGSAIYAFDQITLGRGLELSQCTFADNLGANGSVAFENRMSLKVSACLFQGNINGSGPTVRPERRDLFALQEANVMLETEFPNWTDSPEVSLDFVAPEQRGARIVLAPLANWGGQVVTSPIVTTSRLDPEVLDRTQRTLEPRDALNEITVRFVTRPGQSTLRIYHPGAVQRRLAPGEILFTTVSGPNSNNQLVLRIGGKLGLRWRVETSTGLTGFQPTGIVVTRSGFGLQTVLVSLPAPLPERYFVRLVPEP